MRATKQITCIKHLTYAERLSFLNLPMMHYRRIHGDMIMVFKIVTCIMDSTVSCNCISSHCVTRGNKQELTQKNVHYNLTNFLLIELFQSGIVCQTVISACSVGVFEKRLDFFWSNQDCLLNWKATKTGIGNRSLV